MIINVTKEIDSRILEGVPFDVDKRVDFVIQNVNQYPVKDVDPYNLADLMKKEA